MQQSLPELSFEFFPPRTDKGVENLAVVQGELAKLNPEFFSVTFGAGGSTQDGTYDSIKSILHSGSDAAPHISCVGSSADSIQAMVESYLELGVKRVVALRDALHIEVAAYPDFHPESPNPKKDIENFKRKVDAGANSALTQYFYNVDSYYAYIDEALSIGVDVPIVPGIMPITNCAQIIRFSDGCGAEIPRWIRTRLEQYQDNEQELKAFGLDVVTHLCMDLLDNGVPGLHFYTLNKTEPVAEICRRLGYGE